MAFGIAQTITAGTTADIDYVVTDDILIYGGHTLLVSGGAIGDKVTFSILSGAAVLAQFVSNWYINPNDTIQSLPTANYPAKIIAGLTMRVTYESTGTSDVWVAINYNLEKVLE
jgi:hypothetical protein